MSGLAGVLWLDGRPGRAEDAAALLAWIGHRGPDGLRADASGPCVLGVARCLRTAEAAREAQPIVSEDGAVRVTFDGRLDNRDEIARAVAVAPTAGDAALVAGAYARWGPAMLERLLGDFALALWDGRARRLFLARDVFGRRPLLYRAWRGGFWWASELQALARLGGARVNEGMVGELLADRVTSLVETLVDGVLRLPPASCLTASAGGTVCVRRYWEPRATPTPERRDSREHDEAFRALFAEAVRGRLRASPPPALMLSGGLDSSAIAAQAAAFARTGEVPTIAAFSMSSPGHAGDETPYFTAVARHLELPLVVAPLAGAGLDDYRRDAARALDLPESPTSMAARPLREAMRAAGVRTFLSGFGGDEWLGGSPIVAADYLHEGRWGALGRRAWAERRTRPPARALALALWLQLPWSLRARLRRTLRFKRPPPWIAPSLAHRVALEDRLCALPTPPPLLAHRQRALVEWAAGSDATHLAEWQERVEASYGLEEWVPFFDRRLVEWALALPEEECWAAGQTKVLLRRVARAWLPPEVVSPRPRVDYSWIVARALDGCGGAPFLLEVARARRDWVVPEQVARLWQAITAAKAGGQRLGRPVWALWLLVAVHLACEAIEAACVPARTGTDEQLNAVLSCLASAGNGTLPAEPWRGSRVQCREVLP